MAAVLPFFVGLSLVMTVLGCAIWWYENDAFSIAIMVHRR